MELLSHIVILYLTFRGMSDSFPGICAILHSHHQCVRVANSPHPCLVIAVILALAILINPYTPPPPLFWLHHEACRIQPRLGIEHRPIAMKALRTTGPPGKSLISYTLNSKFI